MLNSLVECFDSCTPHFLKRELKRRIPGIDRLIYRVLRQVTPNRSVVCRIRRGTLKDRQFVCSLKYERDYWLGIWESNIEEFLASHLQRGDVFYDVGVHKGYFSLIAASMVGPRGRVVGFEPNPANRKAAAENFCLNSDLAERITLEPCAVTDKAGSVRFTGGPDSTMGHVVQDGEGSSDYTVEAISIDEFVALGNPAPSLVKMDIEGGERWALLGMIEILTKHKPILVVEVHDAVSYGVLTKVAAETGCKITDLHGEPLQSEIGFVARSHFVLSPENAQVHHASLATAAGTK